MLLSLMLSFTQPAQAFCGTYVGGAGSEFFNEYAQVAIVRDGGNTTLTIVNDIQGSFTDFALVLPVPEVIQEENANVLEPALFDRLDEYSQARLVTYTCEDFEEMNDSGIMLDSSTEESGGGGGNGVEVEANYIVGEYEVVVLSAEQSQGLFDWLTDNGYQVPGQSIDLLQEYIDGGSYFLAAKVAASAGIQSGDTLSPLQLKYSSDVFQIPVRLGTLNAKEIQDLVVYTLSSYSEGYIGISNYPEFTVEDECMWESEGEEFGTYYSDRFKTAYEAVDDAAWMVEYAWGGGGCDPCSGTPPDAEDLVSLGLDQDLVHYGDYYFTRLHMRYAPQQIDEELMLYNTNLYDQIQQRYIVYDEQLEDRFPVCDVGMVEDPGSCDSNPADGSSADGDSAAAQSCGGCATGGIEIGLFGFVLGIMGIRRRR
ncbi:MAG: DUF2330 domain-containing protein [Myxococcota bacterium]|nr:DUF2330 domain-containing protein [Myxococcota bacterium]